MHAKFSSIFPTPLNEQLLFSGKEYRIQTCTYNVSTWSQFAVDAQYSSVANKRAVPNKRAGWSFDKKIDKRAVLNKRAGWNFAQNTKKCSFIHNSRYFIYSLNM